MKIKMRRTKSIYRFHNSLFILDNYLKKKLKPVKLIKKYNFRNENLPYKQFHEPPCERNKINEIKLTVDPYDTHC